MTISIPQLGIKPNIMIMADRLFLIIELSMKLTRCLTLCKIYLPTLKKRLILLTTLYTVYDQDYKDWLSRSKGALRIVNLNCGGLHAKFDNLKIFLGYCKKVSFPIHVITLQKTHINSKADIQYFELTGHIIVYDLARINSFGDVAIYVHYSFFIRLDIDTFKQDSLVYESM